MAILHDPNFGNLEAFAFDAGGEGRHARHIGLKRQNNQVVHRAEVFADLLLGHRSIHASLVLRIDLRPWHVEPRVGTLRTNFNLTDRREILLKTPLVFLAELAVEIPGLADHGVKN